MSLCARGAYITLLCYAWQETPKGTLPKEAVEDVLASLNEIDQRAVWACFTEKDGRFTQKRMCIEVERVNEISEVKRAAANTRWNARAMHMQSTSNAQHMQNDANHSHSHNTSQKEEEPPLFPLDGETSAAPPKKKNKSRPADYEELRDYVTGELKLTENDAASLWEHWKGNGFKNAGKPIVDWQSTASNWERRKIFFPSMQQPKFQK